VTSQQPKALRPSSVCWRVVKAAKTCVLGGWWMLCRPPSPQEHVTPKTRAQGELCRPANTVRHHSRQPAVRKQPRHGQTKHTNHTVF
jgi:hypothetical protein